MIQDLLVPFFQNPAGSPIRELFPYLGKPGIISFAGGYPSPALFDAPGLAEAAAEAFADPAATLQYGPTEGCGALKEQLVELSRTQGIECQPDELLVTTGSQQGFDLLVRVLVQPGEHVLVETPAYPAALQALRLAGAVLHEVAMDAQGLRIDSVRRALAGLPAGTRTKLLYTVPTFSNPRGTLLPQARRVELIALAREHGFAIVEDDPYSALTFTGDLPPSLYQLAGTGEPNPVIYLASLSKTVAPALRVGWMVGPAGIVRRCAIAKQTADLCTSPLAQQVAARYLQSGRHARTVDAARDEYRRRAQAMGDALRAELGDQLRFEAPAGGMFIWVESQVAVDAKRLFDVAVTEGVLFVPGAAFYPRPTSTVAMRLSFATSSVPEIREGVRRLARSLFTASTSSNPDVTA